MAKLMFAIDFKKKKAQKISEKMLDPFTPPRASITFGKIYLKSVDLSGISFYTAPVS